MFVPGTDGLCHEIIILMNQISEFVPCFLFTVVIRLFSVHSGNRLFSAHSGRHVTWPGLGSVFLFVCVWCMFRCLNVCFVYCKSLTECEDQENILFAKTSAIIAVMSGLNFEPLVDTFVAVSG